ncbi:hypothetical protein CHGG_05402 [Chaetomium globosum CBS 148.51]|uniref:Indoleamine 2,3-dioxygenase n=1 Tax=Chaetomium globosum (strain ATCC 6205 / CBS 148.51 / DSM 1962 / NBRC 6347 / NRRL 1970) TaxID=306901 RepID=Q2H7G3_CHAGB|nr:uncharacterized protein CHGG_05402 [Chaetomium globosum CBS 148.51]EAQ88783.1 hypothetical protein CHGG_05402 [Chaetomium globosum CBS 148.51]
MSPLETPGSLTKGVHTNTPPLSLQDYAVTSNGFLPEEPPLRRLPDPYYAPWESLVETLSISIAEQTLRQQIDRLPVLSTDRLTTEPEWRRACVVLAFLTHGYIWGGETASEGAEVEVWCQFTGGSNGQTLRRCSFLDVVLGVAA